jgi:hypothetical protein
MTDDERYTQLEHYVIAATSHVLSNPCFTDDTPEVVMGIAVGFDMLATAIYITLRDEKFARMLLHTMQVVAGRESDISPERYEVMAMERYDMLKARVLP